MGSSCINVALLVKAIEAIRPNGIIALGVQRSSRHRRQQTQTPAVHYPSSPLHQQFIVPAVHCANSPLSQSSQTLQPAGAGSHAREYSQSSWCSQGVSMCSIWFLATLVHDLQCAWREDIWNTVINEIFIKYLTSIILGTSLCVPIGRVCWKPLECVAHTGPKVAWAHANVKHRHKCKLVGKTRRSLRTLH